MDAPLAQPAYGLGTKLLASTSALYRPATGLRLMHRFDEGITRAITGACA